MNRRNWSAPKQNDNLLNNLGKLKKTNDIWLIEQFATVGCLYVVVYFLMLHEKGGMWNIATCLIAINKRFSYNT